MPMHVQVCTGERGGAETGVCCLGTWEQGAPPAQLCSLGYGTPPCPCSLKKANFLAVKGRLPAVGSTALLSMVHPWVHPSAASCPEQGDSHHHVPLACVTPPCSLAHRTAQLLPHF